MGSRTLNQDLLVGKLLGHYRILEKIGAGGMGEVYRARDEHLSRDVAIKVLSPGTLTNESSRKHFHKEALVLSQLNHPNIATIHDFDTEEGVDFLVMEYISGVTLSERLAAGPLSKEEVLTLGMQLAEGLSAAHEHGVIHRDLKPANLRLTDAGWLKILDFGLAKLRRPVTDPGATQSLTETQLLSGTLPYMAPEQLLGEELDARTDIYAAGCVLYEMVAGQGPFAQVESSQLIGAILRKPAPSLTVLNPKLLPELERIIGKCLEKQPRNRYQSAKDLRADLQRLAERKKTRHLAEKARAVLSWAIVRHHAAMLAISGIVVVLLLLGIVLHRPARKNPTAAEVPRSIAVLPFVDLSPNRDQGYFSDGLAEELLNSLAKIPGLRVAARTSAFQFKGKNEDLQVIGQKLNVATVLEGSVRKQGARVRIAAQLIQVSDGFHLWSETYDRDLTDIFAVQEDIARAVAGSLRMTLLGEKYISARGTNVEAYNAYLEARYFQEQNPTQENVSKAINHFEQAIQFDPAYAPAWAGLARVRDVETGFLGLVPAEQGYRRVREATQRALDLDPNLAQGYQSLATLKLFYDWDWAGAYTASQRALALDPGNAEIMLDAAWVSATLGHFDEALALNRRAIELDPLTPSVYSNFALHAIYAGRFQEAVAACNKALELNPAYMRVHRLLGRIYLAQSRPQDALAEMRREPDLTFRFQGLALAYHALGQKQESDAALSELIAKFQTSAAFQIAEAFAFRGEIDQSFAWLDRAYAQRDSGLTEIKGDLLLKRLESDRRYAAFVQKMRLSD